MTTKNDGTKHETGTGAGAGTGTSAGAGAGTGGGRIPMPWEMFGADAYARGQEAFARGQEMFARGQEAFAHAMHEQIARTQKVMDELAGYEAVAVQRAREAVTDLAKLATDSLDYCARLSAEWRKIAVETGRRAADQTKPRA